MPAIWPGAEDRAADLSEGSTFDILAVRTVAYGVRAAYFVNYWWAALCKLLPATL